MICLWCHEQIIENISWRNVFWPNQLKKICTSCEKKLQFIEGPTCKHCHRRSQTSICSDCKEWLKYFKEDPLEKNVSIYIYNDFMKEIITQWKYRGDYVLVEMFKKTFNNHFKKHYRHLIKDALIIPIPLSEERLLERGFNQAEALANLLPYKIQISTNLLFRKYSEKQAKKTRFERLHSNNSFVIAERIKNPVILVDDIYTTGMTLRHAALSLRSHGCPSVYAITLIRG